MFILQKFVAYTVLLDPFSERFHSLLMSKIARFFRSIQYLHNFPRSFEKSLWTLLTWLRMAFFFPAKLQTVVKENTSIVSSFLFLFALYFIPVFSGMFLHIFCAYGYHNAPSLYIVQENVSNGPNSISTGLGSIVVTFLKLNWEWNLTLDKYWDNVKLQPVLQHGQLSTIILQDFLEAGLRSRKVLFFNVLH